MTRQSYSCCFLTEFQDSHASFSSTDADASTEVCGVAPGVDFGLTGSLVHSSIIR